MRRSMDWTLENNMIDGLLFCATLTSSAGFRGRKEPGPRAPYQKGSPTMLMCLAICTTCACLLVVFISEESLFVNAIKV